MTVVDRVVKPTLQRRRQAAGSIERATKQIADVRGDVGLPWQVSGLLDQLERRGAIDAKQRQAGDEFTRLFHIAAIDPLKAARMDKEIQRTPYGFGGIEFNRGSEDARRRIHGALDALGGLHNISGSCAYLVLGVGMSRNEWAARWRHRGINPHSATGVLQATLGVLVKHFGY